MSLAEMRQSKPVSGLYDLLKDRKHNPDVLYRFKDPFAIIECHLSRELVIKSLHLWIAKDI